MSSHIFHAPVLHTSVASPPPKRHILSPFQKWWRADPRANASYAKGKGKEMAVIDLSDEDGEVEKERKYPVVSDVIVVDDESGEEKGQKDGMEGEGVRGEAVVVEEEGSWDSDAGG
ncbi:hypothetical protein HK104_005121, partial [Borealophlyctis nickersoniae]